LGLKKPKIVVIRSKKEGAHNENVLCEEDEEVLLMLS
jgi:hypothetical protein